MLITQNTTEMCLGNGKHIQTNLNKCIYNRYFRGFNILICVSKTYLTAEFLFKECQKAF